VTGFQFDNDLCMGKKQEMLKHTMEINELKTILNGKKPYLDTIDNYRQKFCPYFDDVIEEYHPNNLQIELDKEYFLTSESFFDFLSKYIEKFRKYGEIYHR
ncbi:MAG: hypothetical protein K2O42_07405, partial [Oscillospiraceae bacterium]|nr:hypothetical protein [Oscillospiraceae bacterium]